MCLYCRWSYCSLLSYAMNDPSIIATNLVRDRCASSSLKEGSCHIKSSVDNLPLNINHMHVCVEY